MQYLIEFELSDTPCEKEEERVEKVTVEKVEKTKEDKVQKGGETDKFGLGLLEKGVREENLENLDWGC